MLNFTNPQPRNVCFKLNLNDELFFEASPNSGVDTHRDAVRLLKNRKTTISETCGRSLKILEQVVNSDGCKETKLHGFIIHRDFSMELDNEDVRPIKAIIKTLKAYPK